MSIKKFKSKFMVNSNHLSALCRRYLSLIVSDKMSMFMLIFQAPVMFMLISFAFERKFDYLSAGTLMFVISAICVIMATLNSYREICKERDVLIREVNAGLDTTAYVLSKVIVQGGICFLQALILVVGTSLVFPFNLNGFFPYFQYFLMTYLVMMSSTCIGLFISAILKSSDSAILPVLFIIIAQVVLSGSVIILPDDFQFLSVFSITRWGLGGYAHIFNFSELYKAGEEGYKILGVFYNSIYETPLIIDVLVLVGISFVCMILSILSIKRLKKRKF